VNRRAGERGPEPAPSLSAEYDLIRLSDKMNYYDLITDTQAKLNASLLDALHDSGKLVAGGSKRMRLSHVGRRQQPACSPVLSRYRYPFQPRRSTHGTADLPELRGFEEFCQ
jgi:hypothetical protein